MSSFIFWCLKWLAILTVKYTKHPYGMFQLGASVVVDGKRYPFIFESNTNLEVEGVQEYEKEIINHATV